MKLILRADDLGYSEGVNYGIYKSVKEGMVNTVGVMINMERANEGIQLLKQTSVSLGLHMNISNGKPVSDKTEVKSIVNDDGYFKSSKSYRQSEKDFVNYEEALQELESQYQLFKSMVKGKPSYIDIHAVKSMNFYNAAKAVADKHHVIFCGLPINNKVSICNQEVYFKLYDGQGEYDPIEMFNKYIKQNNEYNLFVLHPGFVDQYLLNTSSLNYDRLKDIEFSRSSIIKELIENKKMTLIEFKDLCV